MSFDPGSLGAVRLAQGAKIGALLLRMRSVVPLAARCCCCGCVCGQIFTFTSWEKGCVWPGISPVLQVSAVSPVPYVA